MQELKLSKVLILLSLISYYDSVSVQKCSNSDPTPIIAETKNGKIKGSCSFVDVNDDKEFRSGNVYSWLSIPYAEPPVNENRFKEPIPVKPWSDELDTNKLPNSCMQLVDETHHFEGHKTFELNKSLNMSEDCLYLNVWTPAKAFLKMDLNNPNSKVPILVFIHGGGSVKGSSALDIYDPSVFVALTEIIVVTINYRLGIFGFLHLYDSNENEHIPGNQGILDQHLALKWIFENADAFGGDSSRITLTGHGFGALFASYHLFYRPSWPLFNNIILQSGSILNTAHQPISATESNQRTKEFLSMYSKCKDDDKLLSCIQNIPGEELLQKADQFLNEHFLNYNKYASSYLRTAFPVVIDNRILAEKPINLLANNDFKQCNMISGFVSNEGGLYLTKTPVISNSNPRVNFTALVTYLNNYYIFNTSEPFSNRKKLLTNNILFEYTRLTLKNQADSYLNKIEYLNLLDRIVGDDYWRCSVLNIANYFSKKNKVYVYAYDHRISSSSWSLNMFNGAVHGDDLAVTFGHLLGDPGNKILSSTFNPWRPGKGQSNDNKGIV